MLKHLDISGFKSFAKKTSLSFDTPITAIVGPNGSGKSNVVEAIRFVLGEQSMKSLRGKGGSDLIWKGSRLLGAGSKAKVQITFDNRDRKFAFSASSGASTDLSFDEVVLSREVTSDGGSNYFINNTSVRLKDLTELLGSVNIGASGHHIISQGEADRLLSASAKDRRAMVEDALGLKVFQSRIKDSEKKLEKTAQNMKEVQALRRELAPHLNFLSKQVEKIQKVEELRREFNALFAVYVQDESSAIATSLETIEKKENGVRKELETIATVTAPQAVQSFDKEEENIRTRIGEAERMRDEVVHKRDEASRALGRIEGKLDALASTVSSGPTQVSRATVEELCGEITTIIDTTIASDELAGLKDALTRVRTRVETFTKTLSGGVDTQAVESGRALVLKEKEELESTLSDFDTKIHEHTNTVDSLRAELARASEARREAERSSYEGVARRASLEGTLRECEIMKESLVRRKEVLTNEIKEAEVLVGVSFVASVAPYEETPEKSAAREIEHKKIERIKIKIEDAGGGSGADVMKEYEETKERDAFLSRELADIETSITSLRQLIVELRETIERTFKEGIEKINAQFTEFFKLMFNGGSAFLSIVVEHKRTRDQELLEEGDDALPFEHGIEINVALPHKKVRDLQMLSGGERSLVSIALLFAMSQVNPPPFLVLDETDAALDEANSRRYGDMLDLLSKHSKLIVVTHNRETMSRAQVLYGVTMGIEGASKLLSIKFDEAVQIAK